MNLPGAHGVALVLMPVIVTDAGLYLLLVRAWRSSNLKLAAAGIFLALLFPWPGLIALWLTYDLW